ncbi:suppressor of fused domain protein [Deinococcus cellulosilyticus]|uniref:Suppressor of fused-like domain-containing protein n=1 Tax=Deinococcus cellulosilyticus (strain DSM 18568 / NBRC 106333 / KACC 11606 / 5516J-15) TaxID=1223518 RepID=A0A511NBH9_DEIC1|nr:suppressor of fused domain protein [Deinococcus cellulosilyticus]GEM50160.1 hypothetical protein DC3_57950 [Deinococcus cellulosilyticus NBRC 106333 = KACC 11606]
MLHHVKQWLGEPSQVIVPQKQHPALDPQFAVMTFPSSQSYLRYMTNGASRNVVPGSQAEFGDDLGVRYEYLMHGKQAMDRVCCDLLFRIAQVPYLISRSLDAGETLVISRQHGIGGGSPMTSVYLTYPYEDDPLIYTSDPLGQLKFANLRIQTLWVIPIHESERQLILDQGPDAFEEILHRHKPDFADFRRAALL